VNSIKVYPNGTKVRINGDIEATLHGVTIYSPVWIKYLCVWWNEHDRKEEWLHEDEFEVLNGAMRKIGVTINDRPLDS
jgi:hypothetical protein